MQYAMKCAYPLRIDISLSKPTRGRGEVPPYLKTKIEFILGNAEHLPLKSSYVSFAVCIETLKHLVHPEVALKEIRCVADTALMSTPALSSSFE